MGPLWMGRLRESQNSVPLWPCRKGDPAWSTSEIAYSYVNEVSDHLKEGQEVKVKVIGIDQNNRINLSIKKVTEPPPRPAGGGQGGRPRSGGGRPGGFAPRPAAPKEPTDFEDRLKQFMQSSDSKLSELRYIEKKGTSRRSRR